MIYRFYMYDNRITYMEEVTVYFGNRHYPFKEYVELFGGENAKATFEEKPIQHLLFKNGPGITEIVIEGESFFDAAERARAFVR